MPAALLRRVAGLLALLNVALAVRCFCTDEECEPFGVCDGEVCLVGIVRASHAVIRTCGSALSGCRSSVGRWSDLCACDQPFCNTFAYLRAQTKHEQPLDDALVFQRVDSPDHDQVLPPADAPLSTRTSLLTLLLVIVPLSVGAATVLVVAFNYYCHLC